MLRIAFRARRAGHFRAAVGVTREQVQFAPWILKGEALEDPVEALVADLIEWIGGERPYPEVISAWRTSCPRLPVWEEAMSQGLVARVSVPGQGAVARVTPAGAAFLNRRKLD